MKNRHPGSWLFSSFFLVLVSGSLVFGCVPLEGFDGPVDDTPTEAATGFDDEELVLDGPTYDGLGCHSECELECGSSASCYDACFESCELECQVDCGAECWDDDECYLGCFDVCVHPENAEFSAF